MRPLLALSLALPLLSAPAAAQTALKVGDPLPDFVLPRVVNSPAPTFSPAAAQGKVLVLEFWSTTCSPCIPALEKLAALQRRYPAELQVVGISYDSEARLQKFLTKRPLPGVPLASAPDAQQDINRLFPHQSVSHTVVVGKDRRVVAITSPEQLDEKVLREVAAGRPVRLKPKQDVTSNDAMSYFAVDSTTRYGVSVRPFIQGLPTVARTWRQGPFARRRVTAINLSAPQLFIMAYQATTWRVENRLPDSLRQFDDLYRHCLDVIVPAGQEARLFATMREVLQRALPIEVAWVPATKAAYVLRRRPASRSLPPSVKPADFSFNGGEFTMQGSPIKLLSDYLEDQLEKPVVDETGLAGRYDVLLTIEPENLKPSLDAALAKLGLEVVAAPREIKMLRLTAAPTK